MRSLALANGGHLLVRSYPDGTVALAHIGRDGTVLALTRYVRTPAGEKRYGKPIGSPIGGGGKTAKVVRGADLVKAARARAERRQAKVSAAADTVQGLGTRDRRKVLAGLKVHHLHHLNAELARRSDGRDAHPAKRDVVNAIGKARAAELRGLTDEKLDNRMSKAIEQGKLDWFDVLSREADRRDKAAVSKERRAASAQARRDAAEQAKAEHYEQLLTAGHGDEEAVAQAYGVPVERQRAMAALAQLRHNGYTGAGLREAARQSFRDEVTERYYAAEDVTNGHMLNKAGKAKGVDPQSLFTGGEATARKYASRELLEWWDQNGRITFDEHLAQLLDDPQTARRMKSSRSDFYQ